MPMLKNPHTDLIDETILALGKRPDLGKFWKRATGRARGMKDYSKIIAYGFKGSGDIEGILWRRETLYHINTDSTRELVQSAYKRPNGEKGAAHIPNGLNNSPSDRAYLQHLVGEMQIADPKTRKIKLKQTGRWDWLDARRIAYAFSRLHLQQATRNKPRRTYGVVGKVT